MATALSHSPADILRRVLIDLGHGVDPPGAATTWPIWCAKEPDSDGESTEVPDNVVTVYDTAGVDDARLMVGGPGNRGELVCHYGIQVRVRSTDHVTGHVRAERIRKALAEEIYDQLVTIGSTSYVLHNCSRIGQVLALGTQENAERELFTVNCLAALKVL